MIASEGILRVKDKKLLQKHVDFIVESYRDYDSEKVLHYLSQHLDFKTEIMDRVMDDLLN